MDAVRRAVECSVCMVQFVQPRALPCLHTFCHECVRQLLLTSDRKKKVACPVCKKVHEAPKTGAKGFPVNWQLQTVVDVVREQERTLTDSHMHDSGPEEYQHLAQFFPQLSVVEPTAPHAETYQNVVVHPGVFCNTCLETIFGLRHKCSVCADYDLCDSCKVKGVHGDTGHVMKTFATPLEGVRHPSVLCNTCRRTLYGIRYKCTKCFDFDLCSQCVAERVHDLDHELNYFTQPLEGIGHHGANCNNCKRLIRGERFKCIICPNYDLCYQCQSEQVHAHHDLMGFVQPLTGSLHVDVWCDNCKRSVRGDRYTCLTCENFDLCYQCREKDVHKHDMKVIRHSHQEA